MTVEEAEHALAESYEVDDEDLDHVSGGYNGKCLVTNHCDIVFGHGSSDSEAIHCWKDYMCDHVYMGLLKSHGEIYDVAKCVMNEYINTW